MLGILESTRQLVGLLLDRESPQLSLVAEISDSYEEIQWFWPRVAREPERSEYFEPLFPHTTIADHFEGCLQKWLSRSDHLRMARALLFATESYTFPVMEYKFLPVIQALEVYCNSTGSEKYIDDSEFKLLRDQMTKGLPQCLDVRLKNKLKTSIGFANELSLGDRINLLLDRLSPQTRQYVCRDSEVFSRYLKWTRNYYTHYGDSNGKHLQGKALHWATIQASLLLKIIMLKECGIPESLIQIRLASSHVRREGMRIWAELESHLN